MQAVTSNLSTSINPTPACQGVTLMLFFIATYTKTSNGLQFDSKLVSISVT